MDKIFALLQYVTNIWAQICGLYNLFFQKKPDPKIRENKIKTQVEEEKKVSNLVKDAQVADLNKELMN